MKAITLTAGKAQARVRLDRGGVLTSLRFEPGGKNALLEIPETRDAPLSAYDEAWIGGFDEIFPTLDESQVDGRQFADHGLLWNKPWDLNWSMRDSAGLTCRPSELDVEAQRDIRLRPDGTFVSRHMIRNLSDNPIPFMWGAHISLPLHRDTLVDLTSLGAPDCWPPKVWPGLGPATGEDQFLVVAAPKDGRIGFQTPGSPALTIEFDPDTLPWVHVWVSDGALFDRRAICIEPFSAPDPSLAVCLERGTVRSIPVGGRVAFEVSLRPMSSSKVWSRRRPR